MRRTFVGKTRAIAFGSAVAAFAAAGAFGASPALVEQASDVRFTVDGVALSMPAAYLPAHQLPRGSAPGDAIQMATASAPRPFRELVVIAVPYGARSAGEALPVAAPRGAARYRQILHATRVMQGGAPRPAPIVVLLGRRVAGEISLGRLPFSRSPVAVAEYVVEAGRRLWVVRVSEELPEGAAGAARFARALAGLRLDATGLGTPTTIRARPLRNSRGLRPNDLAFPPWWSGNCDSGNYKGAYPLGPAVDGTPACGPLPSLDGHDQHVFFDPSDHVGALEWECVELSMRFLYLAYGQQPYGGNGSDVVWNYPGSVLQKIHNGGQPPLPVPGDVLSYGTPQKEVGHTSVVESINYDANGNGTISVVEQNATQRGVSVLKTANWFVEGNFYAVTGWLHNPTSPTPSPTPSPGPTPTATPPIPGSASTTEPLNSSPGVVTLPRFHEWGGSIGHPADDAPAGTTVTLTTSTANLFGAPKPSQGTVQFYEEITVNSSAQFIVFKKGNAHATIRSPHLVNGATYYVYAYAGETPVPGTPYAAGTPTNGVLTFGSPVDHIPLAANIAVAVELVQQ